MRSLAQTSLASSRSRLSLAAGKILLAAVLGCTGDGLPGVSADEPTAANDKAPQTASIAPADSLIDASRIDGGLVVLAGCNDAKLAISLAASPNVLVHGLVRDDDAVEKIRHQIRDAGLYGRVSVMAWKDDYLPYADGLVNLLLVPDEAASLPADEIDRVLAPLGIARTIRDGKLSSYRKGWSQDVDQWTHSRYDATGNAVSKDRRVGPPRYLQWEALPRWNRGVKTSSVVSARGRLFYILNDSHFSVRSQTWSLIARDANNGIQLWRRELAGWEGSKGGKKVGPAQVHRRLVASGDRVYVTLGQRTEVSVLDAATGGLVRTLEGTGPAEEFILSGGIVVVLVNPNTPAGIRRGEGGDMRLVAVDPETGRIAWEHSCRLILPLTMVADGKQVVYHDGRVIQSLSLKTGQPQWTSAPTGQSLARRDQAHPDSPGADKSTIILAPQFAPTMIMYEDVVAFAGGRQINVVSASDGTELWRSDYAATNYSAPVDLFGFGGCLWGPDKEMNLWRPVDDNLDFNAYNLQTGAVEKRVEGDYGFRFQHHRCHQMKVVDGKVIAGRAGVEFLDTRSGDVAAHHWMRGSCFYGVLPANGRLYVPPHDCACYVRAKLSGFMALNANPPLRRNKISEHRRLRRGPAYGTTESDNGIQAAADDWPTYRHDAARSGRASTKLGPELLLGWQREVGGRLTAPVVAQGRVFLASTDTHTLFALDAATGEEIWQAALDGPIDSPPTIYQGLVLCGCRDGKVYALRADDGTSVWQFSACPEQRWIVSRGRLESVWPVAGSILVENDTAYFAAGKSSYLDGGIRLHGLDPHTGEKKFEKVLSSRAADGSEILDQEGVVGCLSGILSSNGQRLFMRHRVFDLSGQSKQERIVHLHGADGFLSEDTTHRLLWTYAPMFTSPHQGAFYDMRLSRTLFPSGRILCEGEDTIYGFGQNHYNRISADPGGQWALFAANKHNDVPLDLTAREYRSLALSKKNSVQFRWWKTIPIQARSLVKTDDALFVAGPLGSESTSQDALDGKTEARLLAVSPDHGHVMAEMTLPSTPVWDGMAAAAGSLFVSLADGRLLCLWPVDLGRPGTPLSISAWRQKLPPVTITEEPGLVGRWRFDEGQGMLARDSSGQGHDAKVFGNWGRLADGNCLVADGHPRAAVIEDSKHLQFGNNDFTLAVWVNAQGHNSRLLGKESFPQNWWVINILDDGRAELVLGEGRGAGKSVRRTSQASLAINAWTHLVAVVDRNAEEIRWYVNGRSSGRQSIPKSMTKGLDAAGADISIPSRHKPFRGNIGDLRIYRRALTAQRIAELFEEGTYRLVKTDAEEESIQ